MIKKDKKVKMEKNMKNYNTQQTSYCQGKALQIGVVVTRKVWNTSILSNVDVLFY